MKNYIFEQYMDIKAFFKEIIYILKKRSFLLILILLFIIFINYNKYSNYAEINIPIKQTLIPIINPILINFITVVTILDAYLRINNKKLYSQNIDELFKKNYYFITSTIDRNPYYPSYCESRGSAYRDGLIVTDGSLPQKDLIKELDSLLKILRPLKNKKVLEKDIIRYLRNEDINELKEINNALGQLPIELNKLDIYQNLQAVISSYSSIYFWLKKGSANREFVEQSFWESYIEILEAFRIILQKLPNPMEDC